MKITVVINIFMLVQRILGMQFGKDSKQNQFPHKILLYMNGDIDNFCQGTLISLDWILTTASFLMIVFVFQLFQVITVG